MEIRKATADDFEQVLEMKLKAKACEREYSTSLKPMRECREAYLSYLRNDLTNEDRAVFVAMEREGPVGMITGRIHTTLPIRVLRRQGHVSNLFVVPGHRKRGVATNLVTELLNWFREKGIRDVRLATHWGNAAALKLLGRLGFQEYAVEMTRSLQPDARHTAAT